MAMRVWSRWAPTIGLGLVLGTVALTTACGSTPPPALAPAEAADTLARNLGLSEDQAGCMRSQFERAPEAAAVLDTETAPSDDERTRFLAAIRDCLPPDAFGTTLAATVRAELPEATETQAACVHENVVALTGPEQDRLYLYFSNPATLDVADVGPAGADLLTSCELGWTVEDELGPDTSGAAGPTTTTAG